MTGFIIGLLVGIAGCGVGAYFLYQKKIKQAVAIIGDSTLSVDQKIAKIKELFGI